MICCLNPHCPESSPPCPDSTKYCSSCGTELVSLSNRYRPIKRIGAGGFGVVYLAKDKEMFGGNCVVKQLFHPAQRAKEYFESEAQKLMELGNQSLQIPNLLAYPSDQSYLYLVQEFIQGEALDQYLSRKGVFKEEQVKDFLDSLLPVLSLIHDKKIIHRDIKLENIMRRENGQLVLIDFGIAKQFTDTSYPSKPGTQAGTPGCMPPEQALKGIVKPASDLYSLGAACFHLITGTDPRIAFQEHNYGWSAHWRQYLKQPISKEFGEIIDKLLKDEYQDRYQSAEEVMQALDPPTVKPVISKTNRSRPRWYMGTLITAILLAVSSGLIVLNKNHANTTSPVTEASNAEFYYNRGQALLAKDSKGAIEDFSKAIELQPNYTEAYLYRGLAKFDLDDNKGAIEDFSQAIKLKPNTLTAYAYRGSAWSRLDSNENAKQDWKQAIQIQPDNALSYNSLGNARSNLGDNKAAIKEYDQAIALDPYLYRAYNNRGAAKIKLNDHKSAMEDYSQAIKINPYFYKSYLNRGSTKYEIDDNKGAIEDLTQAIQLKPDSSKSYKVRGVAKFETGDKRGAIEDLTQAIKLKPDSSKSYEVRGVARFETGDKRGAIEDFTQVIKLKPNSSESYYRRGNIRIELGENQGAVEDFKKVVELYQKEGRNKDTDQVYKYVLDKLKELKQ
jgi:serine/threonine protein kinase